MRCGESLNAEGPARAGPSKTFSSVGWWLHHPAHVGHATAATAATVLLGHLGHDCLGGEDVLGDRRRVLKRRTRDHRGVDDACGDEIDDLASGRVEALTLLGPPYVVDNDRPFQAGGL